MPPQLVLAARLGAGSVAGATFHQGLPPADPCRTVAVPQADPANPPPEPSAAVSADGRVLVFASYASLVPEDTNNSSDVYALDLASGHLTIESLLADGVPGNGDSRRPRVSGDGRYLLFEADGRLVSDAPDESKGEVMIRDRRLGITRILVLNPAGERGNRASREATISGDGSVVAFTSGATNLAAGAEPSDPTPAVWALVVATGTITRVSVDTAGRRPPEGVSHSPSISDDGRVIAFTSQAELDAEGVAAPVARRSSPRPPHPRSDVFVRDLEHGVTRRISRRQDGGAANGRSYLPAVSGDGRYIAFVSEASDLVRGDTNAAADVFLHDRVTSATVLVSRGRNGRSGNGSSTRPALSRDGGLVAFEAEASDLVCARDCRGADLDSNLVADIFLFDRASGRTWRINADAAAGWMEPSHLPALDGRADLIAFVSRRPMDDRDRGNDFDLFVRQGCPPGAPRDSPAASVRTRRERPTASAAPR